MRMNKLWSTPKYAFGMYQLLGVKISFDYIIRAECAEIKTWSERRIVHQIQSFRRSKIPVLELICVL